MMTEAMTVVHMKVRTVVPMSLPARLALFMLAMEEEMEKNTIGTTTQNIILINRVPRGSSAPAPGQAKPTTMPRTIPRIIVKKNQLFFRKPPLLLDMISTLLVSKFVPIIFAIFCKVNCILCLKHCKKCGIIVLSLEGLP